MFENSTTEDPPFSEIISSDKLFTEYRHRYIVFAKTYIKNDFASEDIVMESFMAYWQKKNELDKQVNPLAYILTTVKNKSLNYLEHERIKFMSHNKIEEFKLRELNFRISTLKACDPEDVFVDEIKMIITSSLASLSKQSRKIFVMSRFENKSNREIATSLNISVKTVEFHITKILKTLRVNLKDYLLISILLFYYFFY